MSAKAKNTLFKQTIVTLTAATAGPLVAANKYRTYLSIMNTGAGGLNLSFDPLVTPVAGSGLALSPAAAVGSQGGFIEFAILAPSNAISGISTAGTTVSILEGVTAGSQPA